MDQLHQWALTVFKLIRMAVALLVKQAERHGGYEDASVSVVPGEHGPEYRETLEGVSIRYWVTENGPRSAIFNMNVVGFVWARISTEPEDRCIGAIVTVLGGRWEWVALPAEWGDFREGGPVLGSISYSRAGQDRLIEVHMQFIRAGQVRWLLDHIGPPPLNPKGDSQ